MSDPDGLSPERIEQWRRDISTWNIPSDWYEECADMLCAVIAQRELLKRLRQYFFVRPERRSFVRLIDAVIGPDASMESVKEQFSRTDDSKASRP
jgi:hypothetical protein